MDFGGYQWFSVDLCGSRSVLAVLDGYRWFLVVISVVILGGYWWISVVLGWTWWISVVLGGSRLISVFFGGFWWFLVDICGIGWLSL